MGKPRMIILVRHAQSEGNKNREIHQHTPDHRVKLTAEGRAQAHAAGLKLRSLLRSEDTLHFFTSPYRRTRETTEGILSSLTSSDPSPSPFPRHTIKVHEEPRLREQDFGNFQPDSTEMTRMWQERANYGHFFYRIPNGESAADAYDRISGFNESLWRSFGEEDFASVCVLVTHGLMTRVFLMKWYHFSVEYFEDLRNVNHCEFIVMRRNQDSSKYILQNQLRTWSELRRDQKLRERGEPASPEIPVRKKWRGCRDENEGDNERKVGAAAKRPPRRQNTADLFEDRGDSDTDSGNDAAPPHQPSNEQQPALRQNSGRDITGRGLESFNMNGTNTIITSRPDTLRVRHTGGRDGGGTLSGAGSEEDTDSGDNAKPHGSKAAAVRTPPPQRSLAMALKGDLLESIDNGGQTKADALGDQSDVDENSPTEMELQRMKKEDQSFEGSVR